MDKSKELEKHLTVLITKKENLLGLIYCAKAILDSQNLVGVCRASLGLQVDKWNTEISMLNIEIVAVNQAISRLNQKSLDFENEMIAPYDWELEKRKR